MTSTLVIGMSIDPLLEPCLWLNVAVAMGFAHLAWQVPNIRARLFWRLGLPFLALLVAQAPVSAFLARASLERGFPPMEARPHDTPAIVVLGGYAKDAHHVGGDVELGEDTLYRCVRAAEVYRQGPPCWVITSGGFVGGDANKPNLAKSMADFLANHQIPPERILQEDKSRTTFENAVNVAKLLKARGVTRIVLVTDATHLWRAQSCFASQGIDAIPCGCRYGGIEFEWGLDQFLPTGAAVSDLRVVLHEWVGMAWYRWNGWCD